MPLVCVTSPKGGVGRTTLTAGVGVALHRLGWRVVAVDLDQQNALRLNFELPEELPGIVDEIGSERDWDALAVETPTAVRLIPWGAVPARAALGAQAHIAQHPDWLQDRLAGLIADPGVVVVADLPAGPSPINAAVDPLADLHLFVLLADAMSLSLLPKLQQGDYLLPAGDAMPAVGYVLNQVDPRRQLCRDVLALSRDVLGDGLYGMVHQDEAVAEAAACQLTVLDYAPDSVAAQDVAMLARQIHNRLR